MASSVVSLTSAFGIFICLNHDLYDFSDYPEMFL